MPLKSNEYKEALYWSSGFEKDKMADLLKFNKVLFEILLLVHKNCSMLSVHVKASVPGSGLGYPSSLVTVMQLDDVSSYFICYHILLLGC